jgi:hypothetical protein
MPLTISWRGLYKSQALRHHRIFVEERIRAYYARMGLEDWGVTVAETCPIGWHGESGSLPTGGHITVRFFSRRRYFSTAHIYRSDDAYE